MSARQDQVTLKYQVEVESKEEWFGPFEVIDHIKKSGLMNIKRPGAIYKAETIKVQRTHQDNIWDVSVTYRKQTDIVAI